jgi:hypothetical protein
MPKHGIPTCKQGLEMSARQGDHNIFLSGWDTARTECGRSTMRPRSHDRHFGLAIVHRFIEAAPRTVLALLGNIRASFSLPDPVTSHIFYHIKE